MAEVRTVLARLKELGGPSRLPGMASVGIRVDRAFGVGMPAVRRLARELGTDHALAVALWDSGVREARLLAALVEDPDAVTDGQAERWVADLDSWDVCDHTCGLFLRTRFAERKIRAWTRREEPFVRRAGFVLIARDAVHRKDAPDTAFERRLPAIRRGALDERNEVRKAVSWALREIGKRSPHLNRLAVEEAERLVSLGSRSARWVGRDALRELRSQPVRRRLGLG